MSDNPKRLYPLLLGAGLLSVLLLSVVADIAPQSKAAVFAGFSLLSVMWGLWSRRKRKQTLATSHAITFSVDTANRILIGRVLAFAAVAFALLASLDFRWVPGQFWKYPTAGLLSLTLSAVALVGAIYLLRPQIDTFRPTHSLPEVRRVRRKFVLPGAVFLLIMAEANGNWLLPSFQLSHHLQALLFTSGILLVAYGLGGCDGVRLTGISRTALFLLIISAVGLGLRTWQLGEAVHLFVDEIHFYNGVLHLWDDPNFPLLYHIDYYAAQTHFVPYLEQWTVAVFGRDFAGMRLVSALLGTLTIPAVFLLGRAISDNKTGLLAAALLAVFPPHIHFSRLAIINIADPLFGTLALALLVFALRYGRQRDYVLAGLFLGLTSYFYEGGRLLFPVVFVAWFIYVLVVQRMRGHWRNVCLTGLAALLTMMPYYYTAVRQNDALTPRLTEQGRAGELLQAFSEQPAGSVLLRHFGQALLPAMSHLVYSPDSSEFYYGGHTGILLWYVVPFFFLGLFFALFRLGSAGIMLWFWLILGILGISFVMVADWTARFCVLFPVLMALTAIGLRYPVEILWQRTNARHALWLLVPVASLIGIAEVHYYFGEHLTVYNRQVRQVERDLFDAFERAAQIPDLDTIIYVNQDGIFTDLLQTARRFHGFELTYEVWRPSDDIEERMRTLSPDMAYAFALVPGDQQTLETIDRLFPLAQAPWSSYESIPLERQYALYVYYPADSE